MGNKLNTQPGDCAGCSRKAYMASAFVESDIVCCESCDRSPDTHTDDCEVRFGNRRESGAGVV